VAVPAGGGAATRLIENLSEPGSWDLRRDGSALVAAVQPARSVAPRLATWDLRTGVVRWITPANAGSAFAPRWSPDGTFVYFGQYSATPPEAGLFRVKADGSDLQRIHDPLPRAKVGIPQLVTEDGVLFWLQAFSGTEGSSLEALDLASGRERTVGPCLAVRSWRPTEPAALLQTSTCGVIGPPRNFDLLLWNGATGATTPLTDRTKQFSEGADWDPTGSRIVASLRAADGADLGLVTMDPGGAARATVPGSENGREPLWLRSGIAYVWSNIDRRVPEPLFRSPYEVRLIDPARGAPRTLYRSDDEILGIRFVKP
jgi:dipeptidyl aminopeptidase/acylaminoacyl peptidase